MRSHVVMMAGAAIATLCLIGGHGAAVAQNTGDGEPTEHLETSPTAFTSARDPLLAAYQRLHGPPPLLALQAPGADRPAATASPAADDPESMDTINKQLNNPVSSIWSLNFQNNFIFSEGTPSDRQRWSYIPDHWQVGMAPNVTVN